MRQNDNKEYPNDRHDTLGAKCTSDLSKGAFVVACKEQRCRYLDSKHDSLMENCVQTEGTWMVPASVNLLGER